jgi:integrase
VDTPLKKMSSSGSPNPDDPIRWVVENYYAYKSQRSYENAQDAFYHGQAAFVPWLAENNLTPREVTKNDMRSYFEILKREYSPTTQHDYASKVNLAYRKLLNEGVEGIDCNPVDQVKDEEILDEISSEPKPTYEKEVLSNVLRRMPPGGFTASLTMLKTTRRVGGTVNLDLKDVNLDHPGTEWEVAAPISQKPDHLYFGPHCDGGEIFRGEERSTGTKTKTHTMVPIDNELKEALIWWLSIRRGNNKEGPLFTTSCSVPTKRLTPDVIRHQVANAAKKEGYYWEGRDSKSIKPHYFRHWTTTTMRDRVHGSLVDYMRGDKKKISDEYDHYSESKKEEWLDNIPDFLV